MIYISSVLQPNYQKEKKKVSYSPTTPLKKICVARRVRKYRYYFVRNIGFLKTIYNRKLQILNRLE